MRLASNAVPSADPCAVDPAGKTSRRIGRSQAAAHELGAKSRRSPRSMHPTSANLPLAVERRAMPPTLDTQDTPELTDG